MGPTITETEDGYDVLVADAFSVRAYKVDAESWTAELVAEVRVTTRAAV